MAIATTNPTTGEVLRRFAALTDLQIDAKIKTASEAFARHRRSSFAERSGKMRRAAEILEAYQGQGNAIRKRDEVHKMAQANKAFAHFRW